MKTFFCLKFICRICFIVCFSLAFGSCQSNQDTQTINDLVRAGNELLKKDEALSNEWKTEYIKVFTPENLAKFPGNRESLRASLENQIRLLEQKRALNSEVAAKFEQAGQLSQNDEERRFTPLLAESIHRDEETVESFKQQAKLFLDGTVNDSENLEAKFRNLNQLIEEKVKERNRLQAEAKQIIGK